MKRDENKFVKHGKRCVHSSIFLPIIALTIFSFVDLPLFSMAQEIKMSTPIIRTYKVAQATSTAPATEKANVVINSTESVPAGQSTIITPATDASVPMAATVIVTEPSKITDATTPTVVNPPVSGGAIVAPYPVTKTSGEPMPVPVPTPTTSGGEAMNTPVPPAAFSGGEENKKQPNKEDKQFDKGEQFISEDDDGMEMEFVDPKQVKNALKELKNIQSELKRFLKQVKKLPNSADDAATINDLLTQATGFYKNISAPTEDMSLREAMQEFWDARLWDEVNVIRAKVELPKELINIAKDLKKAKKLITQKPFINLGLDISVISGALGEAEAAYNEAKTNYDQGNMEDAQMAMEPIHSGLHPGEIMGVLYQMKEIKYRLKGLKNKEVKGIVDELLVDVIDSANVGDFREANQAMNDIKSELMKIMQKYMKSTSKLDAANKAKFDKLEQIISDKLGAEKQGQKSDQGGELEE
ncbi:hypothetical protein A2482_04140 [Candidatus Falkowbacteria bacterium RIFOXYC2_FULL_48_21]|uniref:Uncharacterized protein n=1 Tax=Candidatus Falkowbacteria bacterium RIFOXYC2_FULL_48_21 TaxID=1798005 RepID=A0A1F5TBV0_9BACT|nr:MAG: hypothetical protein A2482_04140 [Candidatus Falkowbacteria bacterium RIFOXYC2_FULL_48_21]